MVYAYVLIQVAHGKAKSVVKTASKIKGVKKVHGVTGVYDVIAFIEASSLTELSNTLLSRIHRLNGVQRTHTAIVVL